MVASAMAVAPATAAAPATAVVPGVAALAHAARRLAGFSMRLWQAMERNIAGERDRWFPWVVVSFAGGIGIYFALKSEPSAGFAILLACAGVGVAVAVAPGVAVGIKPPYPLIPNHGGVVTASGSPPPTN